MLTFKEIRIRDEIIKLLKDKEVKKAIKEYEKQVALSKQTLGIKSSTKNLDFEIAKKMIDAGFVVSGVAKALEKSNCAPKNRIEANIMES